VVSQTDLYPLHYVSAVEMHCAQMMDFSLACDEVGTLRLTLDLHELNHAVVVPVIGSAKSYSRGPVCDVVASAKENWYAALND
jgi:hypothetical protein